MRLAKEFIQGKPAPPIIQENASVHEAFSLMAKHKLYFLPVVDSQGRLVGALKVETVIPFLSDLRVKPETLKITKMIDRQVLSLGMNDDAIELFDQVSEKGGMIVVTKEERPSGVITRDDIISYLYESAEALIRIGRIEELLKAYILRALPDKNDLQRIIEGVSRGAQGIREAAGNSTLSLDDLTFDNYVSLFVGQYGKVAGLLTVDKDGMFLLLKDVGKLRNAVAHFRPISEGDRERIRRCANLLEPPSEVQSDQPPPLPESDNPVPRVESDRDQSDHDSRYRPLANYLKSQSERELQLTFQEVEQIISNALPTGAYTTKSWWANDSVGHVQSREWLSVGWRVKRVDLDAKTVVFEPSPYDKFFTRLWGELKTKFPQFPIREATSYGTNWHIMGVYRKPNEPRAGFVAATFGQNRKIRVEFYIDPPRESRTPKALFDQLSEMRSEVDQVFRQLNLQLEWDRIDDKHASRVAVYQSGHIDQIGQPDALEALSERVAQTVVHFHTGLTPFMERLGYKYEPN